MKDEEWELIEKQASNKVKSAWPRFDSCKPLPRNIRLGRVLDLIFLCIGLLSDAKRKRITEGLLSDDFYHLFEQEWWMDWSGVFEDDLGYFVEPGDGAKRLFSDQISADFSGGPGPAGGTASAAESYWLINPGYGQLRFLYQFFIMPKEAHSHSWEGYLQGLTRAGSFGVWQKQNRKQFRVIMKFVRFVCEKLEVEAVRREDK